MTELIRDRFGVELPVRTMGLYLSRWDFTPQKPMRKAYEQSAAAVQKWRDEQYLNIAACAKVEGAEICLRDETGLRSDDVRGRSFAPQGQAPVVRVNNQRYGLSIISTVTNLGTMHWKIFDGVLNPDILVDFMNRLIRDAGHEAYLILDSPAFTPDEMANADLKQAVTKLAPARTKRQLVKAAARHLHSAQRQPDRIKSYSEHEPVRYAA